MKYNFSNRALGVPDAGIRFMVNYASKYDDVVSLGRGTPLFPTPSFIYDYIHNRSKTDPEIGMYSGVRIENELKNLIVERIEKDYAFKPSLDEIYLTLGGIGGLFASIMALLQKNDEVIYFDPGYPLHLSQIHIAEARPIFVSYDERNDWSLDLEKLQSSITPKTKVIILTNPNNPTGTILSEKEVRNSRKLY